MQENSHAGDESPHARDGEEADGFLERTHGVELELCNQNVVVARLYGMFHRVGNTTFPDKPGHLLYRDAASCILEVGVYHARRLRWSHAGAMRLLQGVTPPGVLGTNWVIAAGTATPVGDPRPGIAQPILLKVKSNPANYTPEEVFKIIYGVLGLEA